MGLIQTTPRVLTLCRGPRVSVAQCGVLPGIRMVWSLQFIFANYSEAWLYRVSCNTGGPIGKSVFKPSGFLSIFFVRIVYFQWNIFVIVFFDTQ